MSDDANKTTGMPDERAFRDVPVQRDVEPGQEAPQQAPQDLLIARDMTATMRRNTRPSQFFAVYAPAHSQPVPGDPETVYVTLEHGGVLEISRRSGAVRYFAEWNHETGRPVGGQLASASFDQGRVLLSTNRTHCSTEYAPEPDWVGEAKRKVATAGVASLGGGFTETVE